jgi:hypothetical protein
MVCSRVKSKPPLTVRGAAIGRGTNKTPKKTAVSGYMTKRGKNVKAYTRDT